MGNSEFEKLLIHFEELKISMDGQVAKKLNLELFHRIIKRLDSFSPECEECSRTLKELEDHISKLKAKQGRFDKNDFKQNNIKINSIISHLKKQHKLVTEGSYLGIYMSLGMSIGVAFGLAVFHNLALGIPIGMCMGIAIGTALDADAKKKDMTI